MPHMPDLRVVVLSQIRRHEEIDPLRVSRLVDRIGAEGIQVNPMVCTRAPGGELILLDGATRTESLKRIGLTHAVIQLVDPDDVALETWHHVVRGCRPEELLGAVRTRDGLSLGEELGTPCIHLSSGTRHLVQGEGMTANATLASLVSGYVGRWAVARATDPSLESIKWSFPDWTALIEFPTLSIEDVMQAAVTEDLLPAGITRFLVKERALRLNVPLDLLRGADDTETKQSSLDALLEERARDGRIRRYEEPVFILDD